MIKIPPETAELWRIDPMLDRIALLLTIIGSINWGLVGIFGFDMVAWICGGQGSIFARIIYTLVAIAGIWCISLLFRKNQRVLDD